MRRPRIKSPGEGFYHVVSRISGRRFLMDDGEKGILLGMVRAAAAFSGVEVYTYALMDNHFHLLLRVPQREEVDDAELSRRVRALYGPERSGRLFAQWGQWLSAGDTLRVEEAKKRLCSRMYDLSQFIKTFKETYTQDYNRRTGNTGTIWEGRFKSILLEGAYAALMAVGAYIHLNPVRAGMVEEPELARFTGYGAACSGDAAARRGLLALVARALGGEPPGWGWTAAREACREAMDGALLHDSLASPPPPPAPQDQSPPATPDKAPCPSEPVPALCPPAHLRELLRHRCLAFLHGGALGRPPFLLTQANRLPPRCNRRPEGRLDHCRGLDLMPLWGAREAS
ncbi:MAG: transposase [Kiritimatiellae bacterium]|nr:transposase [Kiritimatiellia bacterium]